MQCVNFIIYTTHYCLSQNKCRNYLSQFIIMKLYFISTSCVIFLFKTNLIEVCNDYCRDILRGRPMLISAPPPPPLPFCWRINYAINNIVKKVRHVVSKYTKLRHLKCNSIEHALNAWAMKVNVPVCLIKGI